MLWLLASPPLRERRQACLKGRVLSLGMWLMAMAFQRIEDPMLRFRSVSNLSTKWSLTGYLRWLPFPLGPTFAPQQDGDNGGGLLTWVFKD